MADADLDAALAVLDPLPGRAPTPLLVGLSGGLDSSVLVHALATRRAGAHLRALHVHHGLHAAADDWAAHCQRLCQALGVPLVIARVQVDAGSRLGPEGAARHARHAAFAAALAPGESLVLGHHLDDQAETVLLRLLRASGSAGLAGMQPSRPLAQAALLRPLLGVPRVDLHAYAIRHSLAWCEDPSNASEQADRNFLRLRVLPALQERWPHARAALAGCAARLGEDARLLALATQERLQTLGGGEDWLPVATLAALDPGWRAQVLRLWVVMRGLPPLPGEAHASIAAVLAASRDRAACYRWHGAELRRWGDRLYARHVASAAAVPWSSAWDGRRPLPLPAGGWLGFEGGMASLTDAFGCCTVANRRGGERIRLPGRAHSHALKDRLREAGLPPWERETVPVLADVAGEVLAAGDLLVSGRLQDWSQAQGLRLRWHRGSAD